MADRKGERLTDILLYRMNGLIYAVPESPRGNLFCSRLPSGPVEELSVIEKAANSGVTYRKKEYGHS